MKWIDTLDNKGGIYNLLMELRFQEVKWVRWKEKMSLGDLGSNYKYIYIYIYIYIPKWKKPQKIKQLKSNKYKC